MAVSRPAFEIGTYDHAFPLVVRNDHSAKAKIGRDYVRGLEYHGCLPIEVQTSLDQDEFFLNLAAGMRQYLERSGGQAPKLITVLGGDKTYSDAIGAVHAAKSATDPNLPYEHAAIAHSVLALQPTGDGCDAARPSFTKIPKQLPMPWDWRYVRAHYPIELHIDDATAGGRDTMASSYVGFGAAADLMEYIHLNRKELHQRGEVSLLLHQLRMSLGFTERSRIGINGQVYSAYNVTTVGIMGKRIHAPTRPDIPALAEIATPVLSRAGVLLMAAKLAIGQDAPATITQAGQLTVTSEDASFYVDGDFAGRLKQGSSVDFRVSDIPVPLASMI